VEGVAVGEAVAATAQAISVYANTTSTKKEARSTGSRHPALLNPPQSTTSGISTSTRKTSKWREMSMVITVERPGSGTRTPDCLGKIMRGTIAGRRCNTAGERREGGGVLGIDGGAGPDLIRAASSGGAAEGAGSSTGDRKQEAGDGRDDGKVPTHAGEAPPKAVPLVALALLPPPPMLALGQLVTSLTGGARRAGVEPPTHRAGGAQGHEVPRPPP
jgi:hypothetical protein